VVGSTAHIRSQRSDICRCVAPASHAVVSVLSRLMWHAACSGSMLSWLWHVQPLQAFDAWKVLTVLFLPPVRGCWCRQAIKRRIVKKVGF
jgi:hypothetical protein